VSGERADRCPGYGRLVLGDTSSSRRLGYGKAAELAGIPLARFLSLMGQHHITPFDYDIEELARELGTGA
jgi:hypothetical protein